MIFSTRFFKACMFSFFKNSSGTGMLALVGISLQYEDWDKMNEQVLETVPKGQSFTFRRPNKQENQTSSRYAKSR